MLTAIAIVAVVLAIASAPVWLLRILIRFRSSQDDTPAITDLPSATRIVVTYALCGPVFGLLPFLIVFTLAAANPIRSLFSSVGILAVGTMLIAAYAIGVIPALLTGIIQARIIRDYCRSTGKAISRGYVVLSGAILGCLVAEACYLVLTDISSETFSAGWIVALPGAIAGALVGGFVRVSSPAD